MTTGTLYCIEFLRDINFSIKVMNFNNLTQKYEPIIKIENKIKTILVRLDSYSDFETLELEADEIE